MLLTAETATLGRAKLLLYRSHAARLLAILMTTLMVFAMAAGVNVSAAQAQEDADIPAVSDVADPTADANAFADLAESNTGELADLPGADATDVNNGQSAESPAHAAKPTATKPESGVTYEENPEQWCIENYDFENPEALAEKCDDILMSKQARPMAMTRAASDFGVPRQNEKEIELGRGSDMDAREWYSKWFNSGNQWVLQISPLKSHDFTRFDINFLQAGNEDYYMTHYGTPGDSYTLGLTVDGAAVPGVTAIMWILDQYTTKITLSQAVTVKPGQALRLVSNFEAGGPGEIYTNKGNDRKWSVGAVAHAYEYLAKSVPDIGKCDGISGRSQIYWQNNYQFLNFYADEDADLKKLTYVLKNSHNVSPTSNVGVFGTVFDSNWHVIKKFDTIGAIQWSRDGNNLEFVLPEPSVSIKRGQVIQIEIANVSWSEFNYNQPESDFFACGTVRSAQAPDSTGYVKADANPAPPRKCGQKIALVFDLSASIGRNGLDKTKAAGREVLKRLYNTPTEIGIYNFASDGPANQNENNVSEPLSMTSWDNYVTLWNTVGNMTIPPYPFAGTNWTQGLEQTLNENYDVVYIITDGEPSNSTRNWYAENDWGRVTQKRDIDNAIRMANKLKDQGTRIEAIGVGLHTGSVNVLHDVARFEKTWDYRHWQTPNKAYGYFAYAGNIPGTFVELDNQYYSEAVYQQAISRQKILQFISGPTKGEDWFTPADYNALAGQLTKRILKDCESKLIVKKTVEKLDGSQMDGSEWVFSAEAQPGGLKDASGANQITDSSGYAMWHYDMVDRSQTPSKDVKSTVRVEEEQQPGYVLKLTEDGERAKCTRWNESVKIQPVEGTETGFTVDVDAEGPVVCEVINKQMAPTSFALKKVGMKDGIEIDEPITGAEFKLYASNPDNSLGDPVDQKLEVKPGQTKYSVENLPAGIYYIVETKSAPKYELLPQPIQIKVDYKRNEDGTLATDDQGRHLTEVQILEDGNTVPADVEYVKVLDDEVATIKLVNYETGNLPRTGGAGLIGYVLSAMLLIGAALGLRRKLA